MFDFHALDGDGMAFKPPIFWVSASTLTPVKIPELKTMGPQATGGPDLDPTGSLIITAENR
jgi:hypothetical protein